LTETQSSYRQIFKATSLFGGVQVFTILIGIVRVKFVAVLLGTAGVGLMGLLNAPLQLIISVTGLGITFSAVRDIAEAHGSGDQTKTAKMITTLRRLSWFAGLLGVFVTITLAPLLSQWTFGNREYTWAFIWLSITLLLQTISKGQIALMQGVRRLKDVARASVFGSLIGLFTAIPLFYFFGLKGIVPSLIITAFTGMLLSGYLSRKVKPEIILLSFRETIYYGRNMVKLGIVFTVTGIISTLTGYVLSAFISRTGGVDQVGLYNAGSTIILQSTDLVFAAMATDFFPRLAAINKDDSKMSLFVNQQAEMAILILAPLLILLISLMPLIIRILYTPAFLVMVVFANWMVIGILLKGLVWPAGFIFGAKGDLKLFGIVEIITLIFDIGSNILGYHFYGLEGLGISFIANYIFGLSLTLGLAYKRYGFIYNWMTIKEFLLSLVFLSVVFLISFFIHGPASYYCGALIFGISMTYSFFAIDKRIGLRALISSFLSK
jgi:O-antigen/teichoic acid export membrane protein